MTYNHHDSYWFIFFITMNDGIVHVRFLNVYYDWWVLKLHESSGRINVRINLNNYIHSYEVVLFNNMENVQMLQGASDLYK